MWPFKRKQDELMLAGGKQHHDLLEAPSRVIYPLLTFDTLTTVGPGTSARVVRRPVVTFRPDSLMVDEELATKFLVTDLIVGKTSCMISGEPLYLAHLAKASQRLPLPTCQIAQDIYITVVNISDKPYRFIGTLEGVAVE